MFRHAALLILIAAASASGQGQIVSVVNSASFQAGLPRGGALATVFCTGLLRPTPGIYIADPTQPLPFQLGGVEVFVDGALAPLLAVVIPPEGQTAPVQVNFQVPAERNFAYTTPSVTGGSMFVDQVDTTGTVVGVGKLFGGTVVLEPLPPAALGGFFTDASGNAIAQHASDYSTVSAQNPAHPGETITVYADDFFAVWPPPPLGIPTPAQIPYQYNTQLTASDEVYCCNLYLQSYPFPETSPATAPVTVSFLGLAPGLIGVEQINFVVPANQPPGNWALFFFFSNNCPSPQCQNYSSPYAMLPVQ
ncbi:MAG: hypothetical protein ACLQU1_22585 [Bryobacteraceae bacterium]